jgi:hypothetical protein
MFVPPLNVALTQESLSRLSGFRPPPFLPKWFAKGARDGPRRGRDFARAPNESRPIGAARVARVTRLELTNLDFVSPWRR